MNIEEAIKIKRDELNGEPDPHVTIQQIEQADQLGIEALERLTTVREDWHNNQPVIDVIEEAVAKLPSETEGK